MSQGQSWFYLTLWRGTPPEYTDEANVVISQTASLEADIQESDAVRADIGADLRGDVEIIETDTETISITQTMEVIWIVG